MPTAASSKSFTTLHTTPGDVYQVLSKLKPGKAPGLDDTPPLLLSNCAKGIANSLCLLFNRSFAEGAVPDDWKEALVIPVFKKGDKAIPASYRPIALLPIVSKVLEKVVLAKLSKFIDPQLFSHQSGFRRHDGTHFQLVRLVQEWSTSLDAGQYTGVVFFDIQKAFDRVWHAGLLLKLQHYGVKGPALRWLRSFVSGRRRVAVGGAVSAPVSLDAGVPQGAILSPLLFLVFMNDISHASPTASVNLFADDTSLFVSAKTPATLQSRLQAAVSDLGAWFERWALRINQAKSALLVLCGRCRSIPSLNISVNGSCISQVACHKHLGVHLHPHLSWSPHATASVNKASQKIGLLRRYRKRLPRLVIRSIYATCIRPTLEYAGLAWGGMSARDSERPERTQRSSARLICSLLPRDPLPHDILLARAGLEPLATRRQQQEALLAFRLTNASSRIPAHLSEAFTSWLNSSTAATSSVTLRSSSRLALRLPSPRSELLRRSPFYRAVSLWNSLPLSAKASLSSLRQHFSLGVNPSS